MSRSADWMEIGSNKNKSIQKTASRVLVLYRLQFRFDILFFFREESVTKMKEKINKNRKGKIDK